MNKKQQEAQRKQEDQALTRALLWVGAAVVLEMLVFLINRYYINFRVTEEAVNLASALGTMLRVGRIVGLIALAGGVVWAFLRGKKGQCPCVGIITAIGGAAVMVCAHVALVFQGSGVRMLFLLVPVWAALALIYYLYQREFFLSAVMCCLAVMSLWFIRAAGLSLEMGLSVLALVAVLAVVVLLKKNGGVLAGEQFLPKETNYMAALVTGVITLVVQLAALAMGSVMAYYLIFVVAGWMFALLVYYTVKMM